MGLKFSQEQWHFVNMNSPADLFCHYRENGTIRLKEYDRCRNGHLLLSSFYVNAISCSFEVDVLEYEDGVGIGLYFGDGCFDHYVMVKAGNGTLDIRVPSGVPLGDTFRYDGGKRQYTAASVPFPMIPPYKLGFEANEHGITVLCNGEPVIQETELKASWKKPSARLFAMAVNDLDQRPKSSVVLGEYDVQGIDSGKNLAGICTDASQIPQKGVYLHVAGDNGHQCITDHFGRFDLGYLPEGNYEIVAGAEEKGFGHFNILHNGRACVWNLEPYWLADSREPVTQGDLSNNLMKTSLNGVWRFSMDPDEKGEQQTWYLPNCHPYNQRIRIPGSWQSLRAFGEEFLADCNSLHQASSFRCNWREQGKTAWMQRDITVEESMYGQLVIGAVSGIAKVWLDGNELGCSVDFYSPIRLPLGYLEAGRVYVLTVKVEYPFEGAQCCFGKQGFWFTDSPGIWQNVWLEECPEGQIGELQIDCIRNDNGPVSIKGKAEAALIPKEKRELEWEYGCRKGELQIHGRLEPGQLYRLDLIYCAPCGMVPAEFIYGDTSMMLEFDATFGDAYDCVTVYLQSDRAENDSILKLGESEEVGLHILHMSLGEVALNYEIDLELEGEAHRSRALKLNRERGTVEAVFELEAAGLEDWSPKHPNRYKLKAMLYQMNGIAKEYTVSVSGEGRRCMGTYERWTAFRTAGQKNAGDGTPYVSVNGEIHYIRGVLDQGYNPWGLYTYPSLAGDEPGSMLYDIKAAEQCGYNLIRMHIKDNDPEWYDLCDKKGMLVWDEIPSNFYGTWEDRLWRGLHYRRLKAMARKHNYHPSVVICSVFNESWGILGDHERSPWDIKDAQEWIRSSAVIYKKMAPGVLTLDNSGYGKTSQTDILDYHSYPVEFSDAMDFFQRLETQNYPGSSFNCYNEENRRLMMEEPVRDLLQRNCRNPLNTTLFIGADSQKGQPVLISEFVHTNEIERLVRIRGFAGYVRMNLASQENEDTSPLTATRLWRDFGYVHRDMSSADYSEANGENFIFLARPWLTRIKAGERVCIPVYAGIGSEALRDKPLQVHWSLAVMDLYGEWQMDADSGDVDMTVPLLRDRKSAGEGEQGRINLKMPKGMKAACLLAWISDGSTTVCEHDIQFEITEDEADGATCRLSEDIQIVSWNPAAAEAESFSGYTGTYDRDGRHLFWASGRGRVTYRVPVNGKGCRNQLLRLELSSCECLEGTRMTDETQFPSVARIFINGIFCTELKIPDHPWDRRALFSNSSICEEGQATYRKTGASGYGYRFDLPVRLPDSRKGAKVQETVEIAIETDQGGIVIYGNRMGRYGCDPMLLYGDQEAEESHHD